MRPLLKRPSSRSFFLFSFLTFVCLFAGCKKDELLSPSFTSSRLHVPKADWTEKEKLFFNINNQSDILGQPVILPRTKTFPSILIDTYNELVDANEIDSFIYSVVPRLGYPLWLSSTYDVSTDSSNYFVYVPFVKPDSNYISGYLVGYKDYSISNSDLIMNVHTRLDLDSMRNSQKHFNSNTCHELMRFFAFDSLLFNSSASEFNDLYCEVCLDGNTNGIADAPFVPYCDTIEFELCYYVEDSGIDDTDFEDVGWNVVNNPGTFGGGNTSGNFTVIFGGIYSGFSPLDIPSNPGSYNPGNDNIGQLLSDVGNAIGSFFGGAGGAIGDFFSGIFSKKNKYRRCPRVGFTSPDQLESRTLTFICSPYVMLRCNNGRWWETVALIPCSQCDIEEELYKAKIEECKGEATEFTEDIGIEKSDLGYKKAFWAALQCCQLDFPAADCAMRKYLANELGLDDESVEMNCLMEAGQNVYNGVKDFITNNYFDNSLSPNDNIRNYLHEAIESLCSTSSNINLESIEIATYEVILEEFISQHDTEDFDDASTGFTERTLSCSSFSFYPQSSGSAQIACVDQLYLELTIQPGITINTNSFCLSFTLPKVRFNGQTISPGKAADCAAWTANSAAAVAGLFFIEQFELFGKIVSASEMIQIYKATINIQAKLSSCGYASTTNCSSTNCIGTTNNAVWNNGFFEWMSEQFFGCE